MVSSYRYDVWWLDHPWLSGLVFLAPGVILGLGGVGLTWLLISLHDLSPDNVLAGFALGCGGAAIGLIVGMTSLARIDARQAAH